MRIGIDMDDTICRTTEIVHDRCEKYAEARGLNALDVMNDEELRQDFFDEYLEDIYTNVEEKREVVNVIRRLKNKGNEIYIITARNNHMSKNVQKVEEITKNWLTKHQIEPDTIIIDTYGEKRAVACKENKIDIMIDDNPYNYKMIRTYQIKCLLYDDRGKYDLEEGYATNWIEVEKKLERMK